MSRLIPFLVLLLALPAHADWLNAGATAKATVYFDPDTTRVEGNLRKVWQLADLKTRDVAGELSARSLAEYDCVEQRYRILSISTHSGPKLSGKTIFDDTMPGDWQAIHPGNVSAGILKAVCARSS